MRSQSKPIIPPEPLSGQQSSGSEDMHVPARGDSPSSEAGHEVSSVDELVLTLVDTDATPNNAPQAKSKNCFKKDEALLKRNIRQIYPEYYKIYSKRSRIIHKLKQCSSDDVEYESLTEALKQVNKELSECANRPPRAKTYV